MTTQSIPSKQWADYSDDEEEQLPPFPFSWGEKPKIEVVSLREITLNDSCNETPISDSASDTSSSRLSEYSVSSIESYLTTRGGWTIKMKKKTVQIAPELVGAVIGSGGCNIKKLVSSEVDNRCFVCHIYNGLFEIRAENTQCIDRVVPKILALAGINQTQSKKTPTLSKKKPSVSRVKMTNNTIYRLLD